MYDIFKNKYSCSKTSGNYNSSLGLPLTFLSTCLNDDYCILEYGASKPYEIKALCKIIKPYYSFITNVSNAHIENYKSFNEIYKTKIDLYKYTNSKGIAFINTNCISIDKNEVNCEILNFDSKNELSDQAIKIPNHLLYIKLNLSIFL